MQKQASSPFSLTFSEWFIKIAMLLFYNLYIKQKEERKMKLVYLDQDRIVGSGDKKSGGYVVAVGEAKEDFGEKVKSPPGGICILSRISLPVGSVVDIIIDGSPYNSFLVKNVKIIARGKPDELGEAMPKQVRKVFKRHKICFIAYLVFELPNGNHLWVENSFAALYKQ